MPQPNKIEQHELGQYVLDLYSKGKSTREISALILSEKNLSISHNAVSKYLLSVKEEAREASATVRQEHVRKKLPGHLEKVDWIVEDLYKEYQAAGLRDKIAVAKALQPLIELVIGKAPEDPQQNPALSMSDEEVEKRARAILAKRK